MPHSYLSENLAKDTGSFSIHSCTRQGRDKAEAKKEQDFFKKELEEGKDLIEMFLWESLISYLSFPRQHDLGHPSPLRQFVLLFGLLSPHQWDK